jgi:hypothetical protein
MNMPLPALIEQEADFVAARTWADAAVIWASLRVLSCGLPAGGRDVRVSSPDFRWILQQLQFRSEQLLSLEQSNWVLSPTFGWLRLQRLGSFHFQPF